MEHTVPFSITEPLDGAVCFDAIDNQINIPVPSDALVMVSVGGNDALRHQSLL
jgi:hypothetical protein